MNHYDFDSAVLGARFCDGGHAVNGEHSERLRLDPPAPERASTWSIAAQVVLVAIVVICSAAAVIALAY